MREWFAVERRHWGLAALVVLLVLLLFTSRAGSQPADDPARGPYDDRSPLVPDPWSPPPGDTRHVPSPAIAGELSAGATLGGAAALAIGLAEGPDSLTIAGLLGLGVGPSLGHWYSGNAWNPGLTARVGSALVGGVGAMLALGCVDGDTSEPCRFGGDAFLTGAMAYVASTIYEVVTAPSSARRYRRHRGDVRLVVAPMRGQVQVVPGVALAARF